MCDHHTWHHRSKVHTVGLHTVKTQALKILSVSVTRESLRSPGNQTVFTGSVASTGRGLAHRASREDHGLIRAWPRFFSIIQAPLVWSFLQKSLCCQKVLSLFRRALVASGSPKVPLRGSQVTWGDQVQAQYQARRVGPASVGQPGAGWGDTHWAGGACSTGWTAPSTRSPALPPAGPGPPGPPPHPG